MDPTCVKCGGEIVSFMISDATIVTVDPWTFQHKVCPEVVRPKSFTAPKGATSA